MVRTATIFDMFFSSESFAFLRGPYDPVRRYARILQSLQYGQVVSFVGKYGRVLNLIEYGGIVKGRTGAKMPFVPDLPAVAQNQRQTLFVDFGAFLPAGVTLQSTSDAPPTVNLNVHSYNEITDPVPASRISGLPYIGTVANVLGGTGNSNTAILWQVYKCVPGVRYFVEITCGRSDGSDIVEASTFFKCEPLN